MPQPLLGSGLPNLPSGLSDEDSSLVTPLYRAINSLAYTTSIETGNVKYTQAEMPYISQLVNLQGQKSQRLHILATVDIPYGACVNLVDSGGKLGGRLADEALSLPAIAICNQPGGITSGQYGEVLTLQGWTAGVSGTTVGTPYYLATTGQVSTAPGTTIQQFVGIGLGTVGFYFSPEFQ